MFSTVPLVGYSNLTQAANVSYIRTIFIFQAECVLVYMYMVLF